MLIHIKTFFKDYTGLNAEADNSFDVIMLRLLYKEQDVNKIISDFTFFKGQEFFYSESMRCTLIDITYSESDEITVYGEKERGYIISFLFSNQVIINPLQFTQFNKMDNYIFPFSTIPPEYILQLQFFKNLTGSWVSEDEETIMSITNENICILEEEHSVTYLATGMWIGCSYLFYECTGLVIAAREEVMEFGILKNLQDVSSGFIWRKKFNRKT